MREWAKHILGGTRAGTQGLADGSLMKDKKAAADDGYRIGKGKPPVEHQFKPGMSGNPAGRAKGTKNLATAVATASRRTFTVNMGRGRRKLTAFEIGLHQLQREVLKGNRKAFLDYVGILTRHQPAEDTQSMQELLASDRAILADFFKRKDNAGKKTATKK